jgi:hypothetical protein
MQAVLRPQERQRIQARVRLSTAAHLLAAAARHGLLGETLAHCGRFSLRLGGRGIGWLTVAAAGGRVQVSTGAPIAVPSLTLRFPRPRDAVAVLTGARGGRVIPLPGGLAAGRALAYFKTAGARVGAAIAGRPLPGTGQAVEEGIRAALLIEAAVRGVVELANHDSTLRKRRAHMGNGSVELVVADEPRATITVDARQPQLGARIGAAEGGRPSARVSFESARVAIDVLTGTRSAAVALGSGAVKLRGRLSLIQNLFPMLDRLASLLGPG